MDFGGLKDVKAWLDDMFDHTFLASENDPHMELFKQMDEKNIIQLRMLRMLEWKEQQSTCLKR